MTSVAVADKFVEQYIRTVDVKDVTAGQYYVIRDPGNLSASDWDSLSTTTITGQLGESFQSVSNPSVDSSKTGSISLVVNELSRDFDEEVVKAKIHESVYDGTDTKIYLVDYYGDFEGKFQVGNIRVKDTQETNNATTLSINSHSDVAYGSYDAYSGELLHFIDFSPITRTGTTREKVKFTFDF